MILGISDRAAFSRLRATGVDARSRDIRLRHCPADESDDVRVAYAISRKVGNAVTRNRIRRRIRGALEERRHRRAVSLPAGDTLFIVGPRCATLTYDELREQVDALAEKLEKSTVYSS